MKIRYGFDGLSAAAVLLALLLSWVPYGAIASVLLLAFAVARALSTRLEARRSEALWFANTARGLRIRAQTALWRGRGAFLRLQKRWRYWRQYKEFYCQSCGQKLRVPRGKGKLKVTCNACHAQFSIKS